MSPKFDESKLEPEIRSQKIDIKIIRIDIDLDQFKNASKKNQKNFFKKKIIIFIISIAMILSIFLFFVIFFSIKKNPKNQNINEVKKDLKNSTKSSIKKNVKTQITNNLKNSTKSYQKTAAITHKPKQNKPCSFESFDFGLLVKNEIFKTSRPKKVIDMYYTDFDDSYYTEFDKQNYCFGVFVQPNWFRTNRTCVSNKFISNSKETKNFNLSSLDFTNSFSMLKSVLVRVKGSNSAIAVTFHQNKTFKIVDFKLNISNDNSNDFVYIKIAENFNPICNKSLAQDRSVKRFYCYDNLFQLYENGNSPFCKNEYTISLYTYIESFKWYFYI